jgi:hypothetical protein
MLQQRETAPRDLSARLQQAQKLPVPPHDGMYHPAAFAVLDFRRFVQAF